MTQTVVALFEDKTAAQRAVEQLTNDGFTKADVDISESCEPGQVGRYEKPRHEKDDDDAITRFFKSLFGSDEDEARRYTEAAHRCNTIVTVHAKSPEQARKAAMVLDSNGAEDIDNIAPKQAYSGATQPTPQAGTQQNITGTAPQMQPGSTAQQQPGSTASIPIIKEDMQVGKKVVETGGVKIKSRIVERPVEEKLRLREEHVRVERNPVNRPATEADIKNFQQGEKEIIERAEIPVVGKEARVVEEIRLGKEQREHTETVTGTVRNTEVDVQKINNPNTPGSAAPSVSGTAPTGSSTTTPGGTNNPAFNQNPPQPGPGTGKGPDKPAER